MGIARVTEQVTERNVTPAMRSRTGTRRAPDRGHRCSAPCGAPVRGQGGHSRRSPWWRPRSSSRRTGRTFRARDAGAPTGFSVRARSLRTGRRGGEGLLIAPVDGQRGGGVLVDGRDRRLEQRVEDQGQDIGRVSVGVVLGQGPGQHAEGVFDLAIGQEVGDIVPVDQHAQADHVAFFEGHQGTMDPHEMGGPVVAEDEQETDEKGAHAELTPAARPRPTSTRSAGPLPRRR